MTTDDDVKCERVQTPNLLRGDAKLVAEVLAGEVLAFDTEGPVRGVPTETRARIARLRMLVLVFAALGGGKADHAATIYGAVSEGY